MTLARALLLVLVLALAAAGCGDDDEAAGTSTSPPAATTPAPVTAPSGTEPTGTDAEPVVQTRVALYFLRDEKLGVAARAVPGVAVARAAVEALLEGPRPDDALETAIPAGTRLLDLSVSDGLATVDLSGTFDDGGGSASMQARVAQVVATLTQFPGVERVAFRLDGEPVEAIGGEGVLVDPPLGRGDIEAQTPAILVESPAPGETVSAPLRIRGTANTFEANFLVSVTAADGTVLHDGFVTATSGSGERGTFDAVLALADAQPGPVTLTVWEDNMGEGPPGLRNVVEIPLRLAPS